MLRIGIDANNLPGEPALTFPKLGIEKNLHPVTDLEIPCHLFTTPGPKRQNNPNNHKDSSVDYPLRITAHKTARKNINSLEAENATRKDEHNSEDIEENFHENFLCGHEMLR
jgi:hypothetical protein